MVILGHLAHVIGADALGREFQRGAFPGRNLFDGRVDLVAAEGQGFGRQRQPVEPFRQFDHGGIAARAHIGNDRGNGFVHVGRILALHVQKRREARLEIRIAAVQKDRHGSPACWLAIPLAGFGTGLKFPHVRFFDRARYLT